MSGYWNILRLVRADFLAPTRALLDQDRAARFAGQPPGMIPDVPHSDLDGAAQADGGAARC